MTIKEIFELAEKEGKKVYFYATNDYQNAKRVCVWSLSENENYKEFEDICKEGYTKEKYNQILKKDFALNEKGIYELTITYFVFETHTQKIEIEVR